MFKTIVEVIINRQRVKENMCGGLEGGQIEIFEIETISLKKPKGY